MNGVRVNPQCKRSRLDAHRALYNRVHQSTGGSEETTDFARLFLAPGMAHCAADQRRSRTTR